MDKPDPVAYMCPEDPDPYSAFSFKPGRCDSRGCGKQRVPLYKGPLPELGTNELGTLYIGAFRYYLGRRTYAVHDFCSMLVRNLSSVPHGTQDIIRRELYAAFKEDDDARAEGVQRLPLGDKVDRASWDQLYQALVDDYRDRLLDKPRAST